MAGAEPRPAATVILVRGGSRHRRHGLEALMVQRSHRARFMPGVWVFPGGAVSAEDRDEAEGSADPDEAAHLRCVRRELREEAGIDLDDGAELRPWSRWITPEVVPVRFDTRFYLARAPAHARPRPDGQEVVEALWIAPAAALGRRGDGDFELAFPTIKHLEGLTAFPTADEAIAAASERRVEPVLPRVVGTADDFRVVLPEDPDY